MKPTGSAEGFQRAWAKTGTIRNGTLQNIHGKLASESGDPAEGSPVRSGFGADEPGASSREDGMSGLVPMPLMSNGEIAHLQATRARTEQAAPMNFHGASTLAVMQESGPFAAPSMASTSQQRRRAGADSTPDPFSIEVCVQRDSDAGAALADAVQSHSRPPMPAAGQHVNPRTVFSTRGHPLRQPEDRDAQRYILK